MTNAYIDVGERLTKLTGVQVFVAPGYDYSNHESVYNLTINKKIFRVDMQPWDQIDDVYRYLKKHIENEIPEVML